MATTKKETKEVTTTTTKKGEKKMLVERVNNKKVYSSVVVANAELMKKFTASNLAENCENIIFNGTASKPKFREALQEAVKVKFDEWCAAHTAKQKKESNGTRRTSLDIVKDKFSKAIESLSDVEKAELTGSLETILTTAKTKLEAIKKQKKNSIVAKVKKMNAEELEALKKAIAEAEAVTNN